MGHRIHPSGSMVSAIIAAGGWDCPYNPLQRSAESSRPHAGQTPSFQRSRVLTLLEGFSGLQASLPRELLLCFPWRFCLSRYQHSSGQGAGDRKSRRNPQNDAIAGNKCFVNRLARQRVICFGGSKS